jgi:hypothetical protein
MAAESQDMEPIINPNEPPGEVKMPTPEETMKQDQEWMNQEIVDSIPPPVRSAPPAD